MQKTGEQFIPGISSERLRQEHLARYEFVKSKVRGGVVLDVACGTGYGSHALTGVADTVIGVDLSDEALEYAIKNYQAPNLRFIKADCTILPLEDGACDTVISLETIEHLDQAGRGKFLKEISRALKSNGSLVLSTPNKKVTSPDSTQPLNKYHVIEFDKAALERELAPFFKVEQWYGQRFVCGYLLSFWIRKAVRLLEKMTRIRLGIYTTRPAPLVSAWQEGYEPRILLAVCKKL